MNPAAFVLGLADRVDEEMTRQQVRRIVADLQSAEGRLRGADIDNLRRAGVYSEQDLFR